jgi:hypothetical protein
MRDFRREASEKGLKAGLPDGIFEYTKIAVLVYFGRHWNRKLWLFGQKRISVHLVYVFAFW